MITTYTYNHLGNVLSYTNQLGKTQRFVYDMANQKVSETDFNGNTTTYSYDKAGRNIKIINPFDDTQTSTQKLYYDANGNVIEEKNQISATSYNRTVYNYNSMNRLACVASYETELNANLTQYFYDGNGNVTHMIIPSTSVPLASSESITANDKYISYTYDSLGRCIATGGNLSVPKSYEYDFAGHMTKETKPMGSVAYTYDSFDRVTSVSDATSTTPKHTYTFNTLGQRTSMTDETGTTTYAYDGFGNLTTETKGGIIKTSTYDVMGRRTGFNVTNNGTNILSNSYAYDDAGRMTAVSSNGKTMSYTYDDNGNVLTETGADTVTTYAYNNADLVTEKVDSHDNNIVDRYYNIHYDLMGNQTTIDDNITNAFLRCIYTQDGKLDTEYKSSADGISSEVGYRYDSMGNIISRNVYLSGKGETYYYSYHYGNYNQLDYANVHYTETEYLGAMPDVEYDYTIDYTYDTNGNIASKTEYTPENTVNKAYTYTFDIFGRMTQSTNDDIATTYTYDGDNLRASKITNGVTKNHILDGMNVVADIKGTTTNSYSRGHYIYASNRGTRLFAYFTNVHGDNQTDNHFCFFIF
ncbi:MAG: RHS repeat protein [Clostridia bacterium]|nr:RHS repeat protein [Clostridia bacterium]